MDQIGSAVQRTDLTGTEQSALRQVTHCRAIGRCLRQFSDCTMSEIAALYALRCSLAHDFGLVNPHQRSDLRHAFTLMPDAPFLVQLPSMPWDGQYPVRTEPTLVNMLALGDLGEVVYQRLVAAHHRGALALQERRSNDEFKARYFMLVMSGA